MEWHVAPTNGRGPISPLKTAFWAYLIILQQDTNGNATDFFRPDAKPAEVFRLDSTSTCNAGVLAMQI